MHISQATALSIVAFLPLAFGFPTLLTRQNGVTCQTSSGSPVTGDVTAVINELKGRGGNCAQSNGSGSDCTTLVEHQDAAISICGGVDEGSHLSCTDVANMANEIQQTCLNGAPGDPSTRTGGTFTVSPSTRIEVINTSSV